MVLKRLFYVALGALGLGALAAGPASAQEIPAPERLRDLTSCIEENTPEPSERMRRPVRPPTDYTLATLAVSARDLYAVMACMDIKLDPEAGDGDGVDLMEMIERARTAYGSLPDTDDDDYNEELADVRARFSGAIFDAVAAEVAAQDDLNDARSDLGEVRNTLHTDVDDDDITGVVNDLYRGLELDSAEDADTDDINLPTIAGVSFDGTGAFTGATSVETGVGGTDGSGLTDGLIEIDTDNLGALVDGRRLSVVAIANAQEALAAHNAEEDGAELSSSQRTALSEYIEIHETRVSRYDDAISLIERNAATTGTEDADDIVDAYKSAVSNIERAYAKANAERSDVGRKSGDVESSLQDPGNLLEALVNLAQADLDRAVDRGDEGDDLVPYTDALAEAQAAKTAFDRATADSANPASALLTSLIAGDDTGQALLDAVTTNHGSTVANSEAIAALGDNTDVVEENSESIVDLDLRVTENGETLADHDMKLMQKKEYIDNLAAEIGIDPVTGAGTEANGMSRIDNNETRSMANETAIAANTGHIMENRGMIETNTTMIGENRGMIESNSASIGMNSASISSNADAIAANMNSIGSNASAIGDNRNMIGELSDDLDVVRAGVAASMALAGMPAINGRGISIGVGSFDGESAFAVGFQIQGEMASFKVGVTSASGATGASAGVGFQF